MIGQSVINVTSGGRGRLSTFVAGAFLLFLILVLDDLVLIIPMAALVAVMIMVPIGTFSWRSILDLGRNPLPSSVVMLATVVTTVGTHDLAKGVLVGVLLSGVFFAGKVARLFHVRSRLDQGGKLRTYHVDGQIFFASTEAFVAASDSPSRWRKWSLTSARRISGISPPLAASTRSSSNIAAMAWPSKSSASTRQACIC